MRSIQIAEGNAESTRRRRLAASGCLLNPIVRESCAISRDPPSSSLARECSLIVCVDRECPVLTASAHVCVWFPVWGLFERRRRGRVAMSDVPRELQTQLSGHANPGDLKDQSTNTTNDQLENSDAMDNRR